MIEVTAKRSFKPEKSLRPEKLDNELPFITKGSYTMNELSLNFRGRFRTLVKHQYGVFPEQKVMDFLNTHGFCDVQVNGLVILCNDHEIWELLKNRGKTLTLRPNEQSVIITLKNNIHSARQNYVKRRVIEKMGNLVEGLNFKPETLDLAGIETYPDWKYQIKNNLFTINFDKKTLKQIMDTIFTEQTYLRSYKLGLKDKWELVGDEKL